MITIHQDFTFREYSRGMLATFLRVKKVMIFFIVLPLVLALSPLLGYFTVANYTFGWRELAQIILIPIILFGLMCGLVFILSLAFFRSKPAMFKNIIFRFSGTGMIKSISGMEITRDWKDFTGLKETKSFFLLYISKTDAHIIQKRLFGNQQEMDAFRDLLKANLK